MLTPFYIVCTSVCTCGKSRCEEPDVTLYGPYTTSDEAYECIRGPLKEDDWRFNTIYYYTVIDMSKDIKSTEEARELFNKRIEYGR